MNTAMGTSPDIVLRSPKPDDAADLGRICYEAFKAISDAHNFPPDFPGPDAAIGLMNMMIANPGVYGVAAVTGDGRVVGSNFLWESDQIAGIGPITVDPSVQNSSIGRRLMDDVIRRSDEEGHLSVRLVQAAYHNRSLALYTKLGFDTVEPLSLINGTPPRIEIPGYEVRAMTLEDLNAVDDLCRTVHGHTRHNEAAGAIAMDSAVVVEHDGRITGYSTSVGFFGHTVGESNEDLKALIGGVEQFTGSGFLLPTTNNEVMRWCFSHGLRVIQPMTLMSRGLYQGPRGAFLASILF